MNDTDTADEVLETKKTSKTVRRLRWALLVFFVTGLGWYIFKHSSEFSSIKSLKVETLAWVILIQILSLCVFATQFFLVAKAFSIKVPFFHWLRMVISSRFLNRIVPQSGNVFRVAELKLAYDVSIKKYIASMATFGAINRLLGLSVVLVLLSIYRPELKIAGVTARWPLLGILVVSFLAISLLKRLHVSDEPQKSWPGKLKQKLIRLTKRVATIASDAKLLSALLFLEIFMIGFSVTCHLLIFHALGVDLHFSEAALLIIIKRLINVATLTPGNVGILETLYGLVLGDMKDAGAAGILVAAIINITTFIASGLGTLIISAVTYFRGDRV